MAFEDDMIEAGYSDEGEYLESLLDEVEDYYNRQKELESRYEEYDPSYYEELEREKERERREWEQKMEYEKKCVDKWKKNNPDLSIIWRKYFNAISYYAKLSHMGYFFEGLNELYELNKWLNERKPFETERQKQGWGDYFKKLISLYQNELFKFYFSDDEGWIDMSIVSKQARELSSLELYEPSLWKFVCSNYIIDSNSFETVEEEFFWNELYNSEMDYEYWKDTNIEQYNLYAKQWIADNDYYIYGEWQRKHEAEKAEWKNKNLDLWEKYKRNYEIREKNKFILSKIDEYNNKDEKDELDLEDLFEFDDEDFFVVHEDVLEKEQRPFLPDIEINEEIPFDTSTLNQEVQKYIKEEVCSTNFYQLSIEASRYADEVLTQLWTYNNRDDWEMGKLKEHYEYQIRHNTKYSKELFNWWKEKYQSKWKDYIKTDIPIFKRNVETVLKFRLWAFDGNKERFFSLGEKYLTYWRKTIKLMYGYDINEELSFYYDSSRYKDSFWGEDIDYIKRLTSKKEEIEVWKKELQDRLIWKIFYKNDYRNYYPIDSMYKSIKN